MTEQITSTPAIATQGSPEKPTLIGLLRTSCNAFYRYEDLRHMSDAQLKEHGLRRDQVARRVFDELFH